MKDEEITIKKEALLTAYNAATEEQKKILETLFGGEGFKPKDATERIKTFEDACGELGENHPFVYEYQKLDADSKDVIAYLKLRIITAALNEGWKSKFTKNEYRWYPYFKVGGRASYGSPCGLAASRSSLAFSRSVSSFGARLAFMTEELAVYAGKQFADIYKDFLII